MDDYQTGTASPPASSPHQRLGFVVYRAGLAVSRGYERALRPLDVSATEAGLLSSLQYNGPGHVRALARLLGIGRQTIVNVTRSLELKGWITRAPAPHDARLSVFHIAPPGSAKLREIEVIAREFDRALRAVISSDGEDGLIAELARIVEAPFLAYED